MTTRHRRDRPVAADFVMGRYRLEERLGLGGSAEVWRGVDERLGRPVAIKLLHPHLLPDDAARARFEREARAAAALSHPGIVAVYDAEATEDGAAIILELVEGEALSDRLARAGALPPAEAAQIALQLAEALAHAHERGVVHRDVKPGNVLIDAAGRARLVDFGIARVLAAESARVTTAGQVSGTLRYLAPEQLAGEEATSAADVYALGLVLYEMLAGRPAFEATTPIALVEAQQRPPSRVPGAPSELAAIARKAMQPDPARRPPDAAAMAASLGQWQARQVGAEDAGAEDGAHENAAQAWVSALQGEGAAAGAAAVPLAPPAPAFDEVPTVLVPLPDDAEEAAPMEGGRVRPKAARSPRRSERGRPLRERPAWLVPGIVLGALALAVLVVAALGGMTGPAPGLGPGTFVPGPTFESPAPTVAPTESPDEDRGKGPKKTPPGHDDNGDSGATSPRSVSLSPS